MNELERINEHRPGSCALVEIDLDSCRFRVCWRCSNYLEETSCSNGNPVLRTCRNERPSRIIPVDPKSHRRAGRGSKRDFDAQFILQRFRNGDSFRRSCETPNRDAITIKRPAPGAVRKSGLHRPGCWKQNGRIGRKVVTGNDRQFLGRDRVRRQLFRDNFANKINSRDGRNIGGSIPTIGFTLPEN